mmetsp:Transcript_2574/g.4003  ORF Transcript_2574/g.4003 Transcript_2574/m.4003 type:complete len:199 (+) Transcript_2574:433-1029(+)
MTGSSSSSAFKLGTGIASIFSSQKPTTTTALKHTTTTRDQITIDKQWEIRTLYLTWYLHKLTCDDKQNRWVGEDRQLIEKTKLCIKYTTDVLALPQNKTEGSRLVTVLSKPMPDGDVNDWEHERQQAATELQSLIFMQLREEDGLINPSSKKISTICERIRSINSKNKAKMPAGQTLLTVFSPLVHRTPPGDDMEPEL